MSKCAIIYWSGTGNTQAMAEAILNGAKKKLDDVELFDCNAITPEKALEYDRLAFGCPAMGDEELEDAEFLPFYEKVEPHLKGKKVAIFGSYEWNNGEWMVAWAQRLADLGIEIFQNEGLAVYDAPKPEDIEKCEAFGEGFASY